jgi:ABC-2 type transport system ATP-binding protein
MTVEEYLSFWADMKEFLKMRNRRRLILWLTIVVLPSILSSDKRAFQGYRQRVGFSQAILTKPDILILDEPTEGLDPNQRQDIANLIRQLGKERTVIFLPMCLASSQKLPVEWLLSIREQL